MNELQQGYMIMFEYTLKSAGVYCLSLSGWNLYRYFRKISPKEKLKRFFKNTYDNPPFLVDYKEEDNGDFFLYSMPDGMKFKEIEKESEAISNMLKADIRMWHEFNRLFIRSNNTQLKKTYFDLDFVLDKLSDYKLGIPIGYSREGFVIHDLMDSGKNILVSGTIRYGKSNFLNMVITSLLNAYSLKFYLIDLKNGVEFKDFQKYAKGYAENVEETQLIFKELLNEHIDRMNLIKKANRKTIGNLRPHIIVIIDEFAALFSAKIDIFKTLVQQTGASGIHFIISTQYPRSDIVDNIIRTNCDVRIALRMKEPDASRVVLQNDSASQLPTTPGRAIYQYDKDIEVQIPLIENIPDLLKGVDYEDNEGLPSSESGREPQNPLF